MTIQRVLVANRGEIAVRVMRTARRLGVQTVAVYSEADAAMPHVAEADFAICIGPAQVAASYLNIEAILDAARRTGADAIHPGYGFLSENAEFAEVCADAGILFIGPPPDAIRLMGNKRAAKVRMIEAGVPCVPGYEGEDQSDETLIAEAQRIGFPVMVKAAAGGGGRGMRVVTDPDSLPAALRAARSEAKGAFGSDELILERAVLSPRHVEIQVFGDTHGNVIHLGERDCSMQRRHQKVVEESPSPAVDDDLRTRMGEAAVRAAQACGYVGAGTVEFLLDDECNFYFLEMNTRLQVEHPVTECVTGEDLVEWQFRVADGQELPRLQDDVALRGAAIEVRLYAEDPSNGFRPQTGRIEALRWPDHPDIRIDTGVAEGSEISPFYDPMIAKVIASGPDREHARRALIAALEATVLHGLVTNRDFLIRALDHPVFVQGEVRTSFVDQHLEALAGEEGRRPETLDWALAGLALVATSIPGAGDTDWADWTSGAPSWRMRRLQSGEETRWVSLVRSARRAPRFSVVIAEEPALVSADEVNALELGLVQADDGRLVYELDGVRASCAFTHDAADARIWIDRGGRSFAFVDRSEYPPEVAGTGDRIAVAPLDGAVLDVRVKPGDLVLEGDVLVVVEAMKMEHELRAGVDGKVEAVHVGAGQQVRTGQVLVELETEEEQG